MLAAAALPPLLPAASGVPLPLLLVSAGLPEAIEEEGREVTAGMMTAGVPRFVKEREDGVA